MSITKKRRLLYLILLILVVSSATSINLDNNFALPKNRFHVGETVTINLSTFSNVGLRIVTQQDIYQYMGLSHDNLQFNPRYLGNYSIQLVNLTTNALVHTFNFSVDALSSEEIKQNETAILNDSSYGEVTSIELYPKQESYALGQILVIDLQGLRNYTLYIISDDSVYKTIDNLESRFTFVPKHEGSYEIQVLDMNNTLVAQKQFKVASQAHEEISVIATDKVNYAIGEDVIISLFNISEKNYTVTITSGEDVFSYLGTPQDKLTFRPKKEGTYHVELREHGNITKIITFIVHFLEEYQKYLANYTRNYTYVPKPKPQPISNVTASINLSIKTNQNTTYSFEIKVFYNNTEVQAVMPNLVYDTEIILNNSPVEKITFKDLNLSEELNLGIDTVSKEIEAPPNKHFIKVYAIDPSQLNFTEATVTAVAQGNDLWKCKDWNFAGQRCFGNWQKIMDILAGQEYSFTLTKDDPGFAEGSPSTGTPDNGYVDDQDGGTDEKGGTYVQTQVYNGPQSGVGSDYYFIVGEGTTTDNCLSYIVLYYNISALNILPSYITNLEFKISYCHSGENLVTNDFCNNNDPIQKTANGAQDVQVYDWVNSLWVDIGDITFHATSEALYNESYNATGTLSNYVNSTNWIMVRYEANFNTGGGDGFLAIDYAPLTVTYNTPPRIVNLTYPPNNSIVTILPIDFMFNVTDDSGINNCTLFANFSGTFTQNKTSTSITINQINNITEISDDGFYIWNIQCYDNGGLSDFYDYNYTLTVRVPPNITGSVTNNGPVKEGIAITFTGSCTNPGDLFRLVVCNASASYCNASTPSQYILCQGLNSTSTTPSCSYTTKITDAGTHTGDIATCCDNENLCDTTPVSVNAWKVEGAPRVTVQPSDQGSDATAPTTAGYPVTFTITATDPNGDDYYLLACPTNVTGGGSCEFGYTAYCKGDNYNSGSEATCDHTETKGETGAYSWFAFACDNATEGYDILCSIGYNGSGVTGSPFYINNEPVWTHVYSNVSYAKQGNSILMYTTDASDYENDNLKLQCGNESGNYNLCASAFGPGQRNCSFIFNWYDNINHTIYCILNDSFAVSGQNSTNIMADNINPSVTNPQINDTDRIVKKSDIIRLNVTAADGGSGVANVSAFNVSTVYICRIGISDMWEINTSGNSLGCTQTNSNCTIHFTVRDAVGNINSTELFQITIDELNPNVTNPGVNDTDRIVKANQPVKLNITVTDTNSIFNVTVANTSMVQMYQIASTNFWYANTTAGSLGCTQTNSNCTLHFSATDVALNTNSSVVFQLTLDDQSPSVTNIKTNDSDTKVRSTYLLNISAIVTDTNGVSTVTLNGTSLTSSGNTWYTLNRTTDFGCGEGYCILVFTATDILGNVNNSEIINITVDDTKPSIQLNAPINYYNTSSNLINFNFTATDNIDLNITCNITIDGRINNTQPIYALNGSFTNYSRTGLSEGNHSWNITCWDDIPNLNTSETRNFTVDLTPPNISLESPANNTRQTVSSTVIFKYNVTDIISTVANCSLILNNVVDGAPNLQVQETTSQNFTRTLANGQYNWSVNCTDSVGRTGSSRIYNLTVQIAADSEPPTITLNNPENYYNSTTGNMTFFYTPIDALSGIANCTLIINGSINRTNSTPVVESQQNNITVTRIPEGDYWWTINCTDNSTNRNQGNASNGPRLFNVRYPPPTVNLESPPNTTSYPSAQGIVFKYNISYNTSAIRNCSLIINNQVNQTNTTVRSYVSQNFTQYLNAGTYNWSVNCSDIDNRKGASVTYQVTISPPVYIYGVYPADTTQVDRDSANAVVSDNVTLIVKLSNDASLQSVNFYANLTDPNISTEKNILLGTAVSNTSGHAALNFSGRNSVGTKFYAGNYTWWGSSGIYILNGTKTILVYGGLNVSFRFSDELPNLFYGKNSTLRIQEFLKSLGPESDGQLNSTYTAAVNTTLVAPNGTNYTLELVDPDIFEYDQESLQVHELYIYQKLYASPQNIEEMPNLNSNASMLSNSQSDSEIILKDSLQKLKLKSRIVNSKNNKIKALLEFYNKDDVLVENVTKEKGLLGILEDLGLRSSPSLYVDEYTVEVLPEETAIKKIKFNDLQYNGRFDLGIEDVSKDKIKIQNKEIVIAFAIDPTELNFTNATVTSIAKGNALYKCKDWNFSEQKCYNSWAKIIDLVPGMEYNFTFTPEDPGYAETGIASINTKKSIYHPNENVEIIIVVLDNEGHLVAKANVSLRITDPNNISTYYSTDTGSVLEKEDGIYETNYSLTNLEGNYVMFVTATGYNTNDTMVSYFTVKEFYEFDILRDTPLTTDPWKGPFNSSIKIISFTNTSVFNFSEVLPISFTINESGSAIGLVKDNKKILMWHNIPNNSVVTYSAVPPLITPELYEIGPSYVSYGSQLFYEARPWYVAVDPVAVYNSTIGSPECTSIVSPCVAPSSLLQCCDNQPSPGPEPNQPNTIDACNDGTTTPGSCHSDESIENITVIDLNNSNFYIGDTIRVNYTAYCWGTADRIAVYYTNSTSSIGWKRITAGNPTCPGAGYYTFTELIVIDRVIGRHAVRAINRYNANIASDCDIDTSYFDVDDVIFPVTTRPPNVTNLTNPFNKSIINFIPIDFNFTVVDYDSNLNRCVLWLNASGSWQENKTRNNPINNSNNNITTSFADGTFIWNIQCFDIEEGSDFYDYNYTVTIDAPPDIRTNVSVIANVTEGQNIIFYANCTNLGDSFRLLVCNAPATYCNASTSSQYIVCNGTNSVSSDLNRSCILTTNNSYAGPHVGDIANCCDDGGLCDATAVSVQDWEIYSPPKITAGPSDQGSSKATPTPAGNALNFSVTADDPNDDTQYKLLVCNTSGRSGLECESGALKYCEAFASDNTQASCTYASTTGKSGNYSWWVFVCDNSDYYLCSPAANGTGTTGSPFYINNKPTLVNITSDNYIAKYNQLATILTVSAQDQENDALRLQCGNETGNYNLCTGSYGSGERSCSFNAPWTDDNQHTVYCVLNDSFSVSGENTTILTADNTVPLVFLLTPDNSSFDIDGSVSFTYNFTDVNNGSVCQLWIKSSGSWNVYATNLTPQKGQTNTFGPYNFNDGVYIWNIWCNDSVNNGAFNNTNFTLYVDTSAPTIDLINPTNGETRYVSTIKFYYEVNDISNISNCSLVINNEVNGTPEYDVSKNNPNEYFERTLNDGFYNWSVNCTDANGFTGNSTTWNLTVNAVDEPPTVALNRPIQDTYFRIYNVSFYYNASDDNGIKNCSLYIDDIFNKTNSSIVSFTQENNFTVNNIPEGQHNWTVECIDTVDQAVKPSVLLFYIDLTAPQVSLVSPGNATTFNESDRIPFKYSVVDVFGAEELANCTLFINNTFANMHTNVDQYVNDTFIETLPNGPITWYITCYDTAGNSNTSEVYSLLVNSSLKIWNNSFDLTNQVEGIWKVNTNAAAKWFYPVNLTNTRNFTHDTSAPNITLISPANNANITYTTVVFTYNVTDTFTNVTNCSLIVDNQITQTNYSISEISQNSFTQTLSYGTHIWQINCTDYVSNIGNSSRYTLNIRFKDLTLNASHIVFSKISPIEGETIYINATIFNIGTEKIDDNFYVRFYDGDPDNGGIQIDGDQLVIGLNAQSNKTVNVTWQAIMGTHDIWVFADATQVVNESNETNNEVHNAIYINAYHLYYGESYARFYLDTAINLSVYTWLNGTNFSANIFVVDSDNINGISWPNLKAISRNLSGSLRINDFEDIDRALNMSLFNDSINRTYTYNGNILATKNFSIYGSQINNTPIVNSTNTSAFITGILWDSSDPNPGEYNGSQDLIFITEVNPNHPGRYGLYDYEIMVPAMLREYVKPNNDNSITFYTELT